MNGWIRKVSPTIQQFFSVVLKYRENYIGIIPERSIN